MMSEEKIEQIKEQLIDQIKKTFPSDKQDSAISQIEDMNSEELIEFLEKNNMIKDSNPECIFCSIIQKKIPSYILNETKTSLAILEINPISLGHTLIIPKHHSEKISQDEEDLATEISEELKKLNPKKIEIFPSSLFGHSILNVLPVYSHENMSSPRKKADDTELLNLQKELTKKKEEKEIETPKPKEILSEKESWIPKRFP